MGPVVAAPPGQDGSFNFRFGGFFPRGDGDFWAANEAAYTLDHSDFNGAIGGVGYTASINNYFEFDVNADFYAASSRSADRFFVDQDGFPILHDTRLSILPVTVGFRVLPAGRYARRGREGRHYVRRPAPYIGAGVGMAYWQYEEKGDFVVPDPFPATTFSIVYDRVKDTGLEFEKHVLIGIEFPVAQEWNVTLEARHAWVEATPGGALATVNPGKLDLGGTSGFVGVARRF
jgi:hypothetical protein